MVNGTWPERREFLRGLGIAGAGVVAGCSTASGESGEKSREQTDPACADQLDVVEESARLGPGTVPEVRLRLRNTGDAPLQYELLVVFQQGTSLGIDARTGRDRLSGALDPGETAVETATDDARDIRNTGQYELRPSVTCGSP